MRLATAPHTYTDSMSEADLQNTILEAARAGGWWGYHPFDSRRSTPGWPDLVLLRPPQLLFMEIKSAKGVVTPDQRAWLDGLRAAGQWAEVVRPSDLTRIVAMLTARPA